MLENRPEARVVARGLRSRLGLGCREVGAGPGQVVLGPFDPPGEYLSLRDRAGKHSAGAGLLLFSLAKRARDDRWAMTLPSTSPRRGAREKARHTDRGDVSCVRLHHPSSSLALDFTLMTV